MKKRDSEHVRLDLIMLMLTFGIHTLLEILLSVNSILSTDVSYSDTVFPDIAAASATLLELASMSVGLSLICAAFFMGKKKIIYLSIFAAASLYRRILASVITLLIDELSLGDLLMSVSVFLLDLALLVAAALIISIFANKYIRSAHIRQSTALFSEGALMTDTDPIYPFKKIYGKDNSLQNALLFIGILLSAVMLVSRTVGIFMTPKINLPMTVIGYVGDILIAPLSYAISCLLLSVIYARNEKRKAMRKLFEET